MMATGAVTATPIPRHAPPRAAVYYPESDGKPMAESDLHRQVMSDVISMLERWFVGHSDDVYVSGNILVYYVEGDPRRSVSPDALVIKGVRHGQRRVVKLWEEGRVPQVVFEVTSSSTRREDTGRKRLLYAQLGVREYYMYDPTGDYLEPRLQAWVLADDPTNGHDYRPLPRLTEAPGYFSPELGLEVRLRRDGSLGLRDPVSGEWLATNAELYAARQQAETARQRAETARQQAETARQQAEARAAAEARARVRLERELARLRARNTERG